jgi:1-acyl-sn-glycerol-3-phosphate acyltransferase
LSPRGISGRILGYLLDAGCWALGYDIKTRGRENYTQSPSTLVVYNHRRDADTPIIGNVLFGRHSLFSRTPRPTFVAREDLFRPHFLSSYLENWPSPLRALLSPLGLRPFLWALQAYPMRRIQERTLGEVLEDVHHLFGDLPLEDVLKPDWVERFARLAPAGSHLTVKQALEDRFRPLLRQGYGLTKLTRGRFRAIKPHERATIDRHLQLFVKLLERGETLQLAPEGAVSKDGGFARIRAGLHVLLNRPRTLVRVLPVGITYDFMTCGRSTVFVNIGHEMTNLRGLKPSEASAQVAKAIWAQSTITASQLASQLLSIIRNRGGHTVTEAELVQYVAEEAQRWAVDGLYVDPRLLVTSEREKRMAEYIEHCVQSGELIPRTMGRYALRSPNGKPSPAWWGDPQGQINYINNEFTTLTRMVRST